MLAAMGGSACTLGRRQWEHEERTEAKEVAGVREPIPRTAAYPGATGPRGF